ncbi:hypothetical protein A0J52_09980 [Clostridium sporogenes]|uniref:hypothetical protein n=1 Tax=Clostridium sporogenes TaxID=1509 RepID=UPI0007800F91|nr:hypothetical protein [Clostridium sporogenes]KYN77180.1 hypothetical protein A0J52_09980 [Clostridium sporogenes]
MRTKIVEVAGKQITVRERKIKELDGLMDKLNVDFDSVLKANSFKDLKGVLTNVLNEKLPIVFPEIKEEDINEAYPSEIEELIGGFIEVNFTGMKKVITPMYGLMQRYLSFSVKN